MCGVLGREAASKYMQNQISRDSGLYHITVVSPPEYQSLGEKYFRQILGLKISYEYLGLGMVSDCRDETYYVVVSASDIDKVRIELCLGHRDLHVTLGFEINDIYGVDKSANTLICRSSD